MKLLAADYTVWNVSKHGVFSGPYFPTSVLNTGRYFVSPCSVWMRENTDEKKLRIWTLFTRCYKKRIICRFIELPRITFFFSVNSRNEQRRSPQHHWVNLFKVTRHIRNVLQVEVENIKHKKRKKYIERVVIPNHLPGGDKRSVTIKAKK